MLRCVCCLFSWCVLVLLGLRFLCDLAQVELPLYVDFQVGVDCVMFGLLFMLLLFWLQVWCAQSPNSFCARMSSSEVCLVVSRFVW